MMEKIWTSLEKKKYYLLFMLILLVIGIVSGVIYYHKQDASNLLHMEEVMNSFIEHLKNSHMNFILSHGIFGMIILLSSITILLLPVSLFFVFYEGMSIGFGVASFTAKFHMKGFFFGTIFQMISKFFYIVLLLFLLWEAIYLARMVLGCLLYRKDTEIKMHFLFHLKRFFVFFFLILLHDILLYFIGNRLALLFSWLISS